MKPWMVMGLATLGLVFGDHTSGWATDKESGIPRSELKVIKGIAVHKKTGKPYSGVTYILGANGKKKLTVRFKKGRLHGYSRQFHPTTGKLIREFPFRHGKNVGTNRFWYKNGRKRGVLKMGKKGKANGKSVFWYENGAKMALFNYRNGRGHGPWFEWSATGQRTFFCVYRNGKSTANCNGTQTDRQWQLDGHKWRTIQYKNNKMHGKWIIWHLDGWKQWERTFRMDVLHGTDIQWHQNGSKARLVHFKDGELHGTATLWDKTGKLTKKCEFKKGKLVRTVMGDCSGLIDYTP